MDCDITEIPGADNLFQAEGIIKPFRINTGNYMMFHIPTC